MTAALGITVTPVKDLKVDMNWRYANKLYSSLDVYSYSSASAKGALQLPDYHLI
ncbi:hypothetical protein [Chryseobacterium sp. CH1]|uniref:hypothetical protein n=1 Tax=Chryseobacterium sp. CH1 TaxID=713551 RepID=UPI0013E99C34|nr:hypothetical protein [Chryseobacterium sp. CH1]